MLTVSKVLSVIAKYSTFINRNKKYNNFYDINSIR